MTWPGFILSQCFEVGNQRGVVHALVLGVDVLERLQPHLLPRRLERGDRASHAQQAIRAPLRNGVGTRAGQVARDDAVDQLERLHIRRHVLRALQDVIAHLGADRTGQLARLHRERHLLECGQHRAPLVHAEIASLVLRRRVVRELRRERVEVLSAPDARQQRIRAAPRGAVGGRRAIHG
jgi:hypothetical protein